ncbi:MAG TPA: Ig domain-containing protein [Verrucomicrobiae bacterium]|nr:Ig domain-containing protein [Verrucomicrobiae bacterium]
MVRILKRIVFSVGLIGLVPMVAGFALLGPVNEAFQIPTIAYDLPGDIGAPKNLAEEYRWTKPVLYYSCDDNFGQYFGGLGIDAIDSAFAVYNQLTNVSSYSVQLDEFPLESMRVNYQAEALGLVDIKSLTMEVLAEQMGLAEPERWVWCLHNRWLQPGTQCPEGQVYDVMKRNFDPVPTGPTQLQSSSYVNGNLFSYFVLEDCSDNPTPSADAAEFPVDPLANQLSAIASFPASYGNFHMGLTRDDVGGIRYLLRTNNYNIEAAGTNTFTFITNTAPQLLFTSNLTEFAILALTNGPGPLQALFPNLQIASSTPIFTNVVTTTPVFFFTNLPFSPAGTPATLVSNILRSTNVLTYWTHQFLNVYLTPNNQLVSNSQIPLVPGHSSGSGLVTVWTTNVTTACGAFVPPGTVCTNITAASFTTNGVFGDYYILPAGLCDVSIVATQLIVPTVVSNFTVVATNDPAVTNVGVQSFTQTGTYTFNQYIYVVRPVVCPENTVGLRQGIERVRFERRDYDSLLGRFFYPVTNTYAVVNLTNNTLSKQTVTRVLTTPDFLITAVDTSPGPSDPNNSPGPIARNQIAFDESNSGNGLAGPGTLEPGTVITYNKVGPIYQNSAPDFLDEAGQVIWFIWGIFDGTTNAPIVFPNGTTIDNIENQIFIQITPNGPALPGGQVDVPYTNSFTVNGGTAPFSWSLSPGSPGLPLGLVMNPVTGEISGTPTEEGEFDFSIRLMDSASRYIDRPYSISITP